MAGRQPVAAGQEILADGTDVPDFSLSAGDLAEHVGDVVDRKHALGVKLRTELREGLFGPGYGCFVARYADFAIAMRNRYAQSIANRPQMLIACTKKGEGSMGIDQRNCRFCHFLRRTEGIAAAPNLGNPVKYTGWAKFASLALPEICKVLQQQHLQR